MSQSNSANMHGHWKALFIGPNSNIKRDLTPLLTRFVPGISAAEVLHYPSHAEIVDAFRVNSPQLCLVDVGADLQASLRVISELQALDSKLSVVAVLPGNDSDLILRCLRQGATEFLLQPFSADQVQSAVEKISRGSAQHAPGAGKIYSIMPVKGGCGASTIACNLAYQLKRNGSKRVLLADLDPLAGTIAFVLKMKGQYSFLDVLNRSADMDADLWKVMVTHRQGVDVLLAPELLLEAINELSNAGPIIEYARRGYDLVVLDTSSVYGDWNLSQARMCDEILLVTTNELTCLQAVQRALTYLDASGIDRSKIRLVVNRYDKHVGLSRDAIGTALHMDVFQFIPSDYDAVQKSLMEGKPVPANTSFGKSLGSLATQLGGGDTPLRKGPALGGLRSLFSRTSS